MEKHFAAQTLREAYIMADAYSSQTGLELEYKETIGFVPGAVFVFECRKPEWMAY